MNSDKIGLFVKCLRESQNMSQEELAGKLYIDRTVVNKIEKGKVNLTVDNLKKISEIFDVSTDEILIGEYRSNENIEVIQNVSLDLYNKNLKSQKRQKILAIMFSLIIIVFLGYFFVSTYNKVKIYTVGVKSDLINFNSGFFIQARDKVYFNVNIDYNFDTKDLEMIKLYYNIDGNDRTIIEANHFMNLEFTDFYGYQEYVDFNKLDKLVDNFYLDLIYKNGEIVKNKLDLTKDYVNNNFFLRKKEKGVIENNDDGEKKDYVNSEISYKFLRLKEKSQEKVENSSYDYPAYELIYNKINYDIFLSDEIINLFYKINGKEYILEYMNFNDGYEYFCLKDETHDIYNFVLYDNKCVNYDCDKVDDTVNLINNVLDKLLN